MRLSTLRGCWQCELAFVGHALGEEGLPAVPTQQQSAAWRAVADPLSPEEGAGAQRGPRLALVVRTPLADPWYRPAGGVVRGGTGQPRWAGHRR
jgi:hypothetical protein